jgi:hypothetical protein
VSHDSERWRELARIVEEALGVEPEAREAFVRKACDGDETT